MKNLLAPLALALSLTIIASSCIGTDVVEEVEATVPPVAVDTTTTEPPMPSDPTSAAREGTLSGRGGYESAGMVTLSTNDNGDVIMTTSPDFRVTLALGTSLYLSNSESGSQTAASGLEVADVSQSLTGEQSFNVTQISANVTVDTYDYVVVLCKPARITFGVAELQ